jgi:hypothetical protein
MTRHQGPCALLAQVPFPALSRHRLARWEEYEMMWTSSVSGIIPTVP